MADQDILPGLRGSGRRRESPVPNPFTAFASTNPWSGSHRRTAVPSRRAIGYAEASQRPHSCLRLLRHNRRVEHTLQIMDPLDHRGEGGHMGFVLCRNERGMAGVALADAGYRQQP